MFKKGFGVSQTTKKQKKKKGVSVFLGPSGSVCNFLSSHR